MDFLSQMQATPVQSGGPSQGLFEPSPAVTARASSQPDFAALLQSLRDAKSSSLASEALSSSFDSLTGQADYLALCLAPGETPDGTPLPADAAYTADPAAPTLDSLANSVQTSASPALVTPSSPVAPLRGAECENPCGAAAPFPRGRGTLAPVGKNSADKTTIGDSKRASSLVRRSRSGKAKPAGEQDVTRLTQPLSLVVALASQQYNSLQPTPWSEAWGELSADSAAIPPEASENGQELTTGASTRSAGGARKKILDLPIAAHAVPQSDLGTGLLTAPFVSSADGQATSAGVASDTDANLPIAVSFEPLVEGQGLSTGVTFTTPVVDASLPMDVRRESLAGPTGPSTEASSEPVVFSAPRRAERQVDAMTLSSGLAAATVAGGELNQGTSPATPSQLTPSEAGRDVVKAPLESLASGNLDTQVVSATATDTAQDDGAVASLASASAANQVARLDSLVIEPTLGVSAIKQPHSTPSSIGALSEPLLSSIEAPTAVSLQDWPLSASIGVQSAALSSLSTDSATRRQGFQTATSLGGSDLRELVVNPEAEPAFTAQSIAGRAQVASVDIPGERAPSSNPSPSEGSISGPGGQGDYGRGVRQSVQSSHSDAKVSSSFERLFAERQYSRNLPSQSNEGGVGSARISIIKKDDSPFVVSSSLATSGLTFVPSENVGSGVVAAPPVGASADLPSAGAPQVTVMPSAGAAQVTVAPSAGAPQVTVAPSAGAAQITVAPSAGAPQVTVAPSAGAPQVAVTPSAEAPQVAVTPSAGAAQVAVAPSAEAAQVTVAPSAEAPQVAVMPSAGAAQITVAPSAGAPQVTVAPSAGAAQITVAPSVGAPQVTVAPSTGAPQVTVAPSAGAAQVAVTPSAGTPTAGSAEVAITPTAAVAVTPTARPTRPVNGTVQPTAMPAQVADIPVIVTAQPEPKDTTKPRGGPPVVEVDIPEAGESAFVLRSPALSAALEVEAASNAIDLQPGEPRESRLDRELASPSKEASILLNIHATVPGVYGAAPTSTKPESQGLSVEAQGGARRDQHESQGRSAPVESGHAAQVLVDPSSVPSSQGRAPIMADPTASTLALTTTTLEDSLEAIRVQIKRNLGVEASRPREIEIDLHPAHLGQIKLQVSLRSDGMLDSTLRTSNPEVAEHLSHHVGSMREQLSQEGVPMRSFTVKLESGHPSLTGGQGQSSAGNHSSSGFQSFRQNFRHFSERGGSTSEGELPIQSVSGPSRHGTSVLSWRV